MDKHDETRDCHEHVIIWEFQVRAGCEADFERVYSPDGDWGDLFARNQDFLGTQLLRDRSAPRRYLTIDRWANAAAFAKFRETHGAEYATLDKKCEAWTESEKVIGTWTEVRGHALPSQS